MANKYQTLADQFFDEFESKVNEIKKKRQIAFYVLCGAALLTVIVGIIENTDISGGIFDYLLLFSIVADIASIVVIKKFSEKIKAEIKQREYSFYDDVFAPMVAGELGGTSTSTSFINTSFKKKDARPGLVLSSRDVVIEGNVNGRPFVYTNGYEDTIHNVTVEEKTNKVVSYTNYLLTSNISLDFKMRKAVGAPMILTPMGKHDRPRRHNVKMDNKYFRFHVDCDDELEAYRYLTADKMEGLQAWNESSTILDVTLSDVSGSVTYPSLVSGMDLKYMPSFGKNMADNRAKYNADAVLQSAVNSIVNIRALVEAIPVSIAG